MLPGHDGDLLLGGGVDRINVHPAYYWIPCVMQKLLMDILISSIACCRTLLRVTRSSKAISGMNLILKIWISSMGLAETG